MFPRTLLIEMITTQNTLNKGMAGSDWLRSTNTTRPYYRAAWIEAAEAISHNGYKWWKAFDSEANLAQTKLEVVDMLHFILADELRHTFISVSANDAQAIVLNEDGSIPESAENILIEMTADRIIEQGTIDIPQANIGVETFTLSCEAFVVNAIMRKRVVIKHWGALADALNLTMGEAGLLYMAKACLNFLRDANGQKTNSYTKIWWGLEDNVWLERYVDSLRKDGLPSNGLAENISEHLQSQYTLLMEGGQPLVV